MKELATFIAKRNKSILLFCVKGIYLLWRLSRFAKKVIIQY